PPTSFLDINPSGAAGDVTIQNLSLDDFSSDGTIRAEWGASTGTLTVADSTITGGSSGNGGAIHSNGMDVVITSSSLSGNSASQAGAVIVTNANLAITDSTFIGNDADYLGGALIKDGTGTLTISGGTFAFNE